MHPMAFVVVDATPAEHRVDTRIEAAQRGPILTATRSGEFGIDSTGEPVILDRHEALRTVYNCANFARPLRKTLRDGEHCLPPLQR